MQTEVISSAFVITFLTFVSSNLIVFCIISASLSASMPSSAISSTIKANSSSVIVGLFLSRRKILLTSIFQPSNISVSGVKII